MEALFGDVRIPCNDIHTVVQSLQCEAKIRIIVGENVIVIA